jgi:hypothetical protein
MPADCRLFIALPQHLDKNQPAVDKKNELLGSNTSAQ